MTNKAWIAIGILFLITIVLEFTFLGGYDSHWWNAIPAFYALFGLAGCVVIIYVAKFISKKFLNRDIDYYDH
jgi:hypothetical protein